MNVSAGGRVWAGEEPLVLASRSAGRLSLLGSCGIEAQARPARIDERAIEADLAQRGAMPVAIARALAAEKARVVSREMPARTVLGADQVLAFEDECWAKAANIDEARARLKQLSGAYHQLISACALAHDGAVAFEAIDIARLQMRALSEVDIETYLALIGRDALASVGSYRIEGVGRLLFDHVEGDQATIIGLPLGRLLGYLRANALIRL
jgi:septum formation protein